MADGQGLTPGIAAAWGVKTPATKGPKPGLGLDRTVAAGVRVADGDGLDAVSMTRVAKELGASAMSLSRYVDSKDELLALMIDAALGAVPPLPAEGDWRARLERWAWATVRGMRAHPWATPAPIARPPPAPHSVA